jgi:hypothetical protein
LLGGTLTESFSDEKGEARAYAIGERDLLRRESPWLRSFEQSAVLCRNAYQNEFQGHFRGGNRSSLPYVSMAESSTRVRPRISLEIAHMRIAGDIRDFGKNGIGHKRQDGMLGGMLATARGTTNFSLIWRNEQNLQVDKITESTVRRSGYAQALHRMTQLTLTLTRARQVRGESAVKIIRPAKGACFNHNCRPAVLTFGTAKNASRATRARGKAILAEHHGVYVRLNISRPRNLGQRFPGGDRPAEQTLQYRTV